MQKETQAPASRTTGRTAQKANILAARAISDAIKTTLGPMGMDKILVTSQNAIIISNDGATILREMAISHPIAKLLVDVAISQEQEIGDGTTSAVILAGELLRHAEALLDKKVHPTHITKGYRQALAFALEELEKLSVSIDLDDTDALVALASTAMTGKGAELAKEHLALLCVQAFKTYYNARKKHDIRVYPLVSQGLLTSTCIGGLVLPRNASNAQFMTESLSGSHKVACLSCGIEVKNLEHASRISITDPRQIQEYLVAETAQLDAQIQAIIESGATLVLSSKGIDDVVLDKLAQANIRAYRRLKQSELELCASVSGSHIVASMRELLPQKLGTFSSIVDEKYGSQEVTIFHHTDVSTIILSASSQVVVDEIERCVEDALGNLKTLAKSNKIVGGAASIEVALAQRLRKFATNFASRERLAIEAFASALESIPQILAENAGLDPLTTLATLQYAHDQGFVSAGVSLTSEQPLDTYKAGVLEPLLLKKHAFTSATEVASLILRIDDIILTGGEE
jgi:chaperonin GroEL (HSP60 family)